MIHEAPIDVTMHVVGAIERAGGDCCIVGSLASIVHGQGRATMDADVIVVLRPDGVESFIRTLGPDYYANTEAVRAAVSAGQSCNVIHIPSGFKVDIYPIGDDAFTRSEFSRRRIEILRQQPRAESFVATPEDVILSKLRWYVEGGEVSDRQWQDVIGVLRVQQGELEDAYLREWARRLGVESLLDRAWSEI